jgi:hypothetical protein
MNLLTYFDNLTDKEKTELLVKNRELIEIVAIESKGGVHFPTKNGFDGIIGKQYLEVKSQCFEGKLKLFGRMKYGSPSYNLWEKKLAANELIIVVGYSSDGTLIYKFELNFEAVSDTYYRAIGATNVDPLIHTYRYHDSFKVIHIADETILQQNINEIQPKFYNWLISLHHKIK